MTILPSALRRLAPPAAALLAGAALACTLPATATAGDGVMEIDQAKAQAGGVTPGDTPGFPVTITRPGSYRLTGNLDVPLGGEGISVQSEGVTLDLNGFAIQSGATCAREKLLGWQCTPKASGSGVYFVSPGGAVMNGRIRGFPSSAVYAPRGHVRIERLDIGHSGIGIYLHDGGIVADNTISDVPLGMDLASGTVQVRGNGINRARTGISANGGAILVERNVVMQTETALYGSGAGPSLAWNVFIGNGTDFAQGSVVQLAPNRCSWQPLCP